MEEYFYKDYIRKPKKVILLSIFFIVTTFITFISVSYYSIEIFKREDFLLNSIVGSIFILVILICEFILMYFLSIKDISNTKITLTDKGIIYEDRKTKINILYRNISEVKLINKKYRSSIIKVCSNKDEIIILSNLDNIDRFIMSINKKLNNERINGLNYNYKSVFDNMLFVISNKVNLIVILWITNMILVFLSSYVVNGKINSFLVAFLVYIYPFIIILLSEVILNSKVNKSKWLRSRSFIYTIVSLITVSIIIMLIAFIKASSNI